MKKYILDEDGNVKEVFDLFEWADWMEQPEKRMIKQEMVDGYLVSTVFLELDSSFDSEQPLLFETMIFDDNLPRKNGFHIDVFEERYATKEEAIKRHEEIVNQIKKGDVQSILQPTIQ